MTPDWAALRGGPFLWWLPLKRAASPLTLRDAVPQDQTPSTTRHSGFPARMSADTSNADFLAFQRDDARAEPLRADPEERVQITPMFLGKPPRRTGGDIRLMVNGCY